MRRTAIIAALFIFLSFPVAGAATGEIQEVNFGPDEAALFQDIPSVYSASKYEQKVTEAPSSVTIITSDEIKKYGYRTLAEILRSVKGFYTSYDRNYSYIGFRGFARPGDYNTRILLLMDGHRINDSIYDTAAIGTDFVLDVDLIERIEIIPGPSSSLYGSNAFLGVINIISRQGRDLQSAELSGAAGRFETFKGRLSYGKRLQNGMELLISGTLYNSEGDERIYFKEFDDPATNNGIAVKADSDASFNIFASLSYKDFTFTNGYGHREKKIPTGVWGTVFNDSRTKTIDERGFIDLKYEHTFEPDLDVMARLSYDLYRYKGDYAYDYSDTADPFIVVNKDWAEGKSYGAELQLSKKLFASHRVILGGQYIRHIQQDQKNYDIDVYLDDKRDSSQWAVFMQDEFQIVSNLICNIGIRHDYYSTFGGTTNPRIALIYTPFEKTSIKLLYGSAFRAPNAYELYYSDGDYTQKANPDLKPEKIKTYEVVLEQYLGKRFRSSLSAYYYRIKDLIAQTTDPSDDLIVFSNLETVESRGIEWQLEGKWENGLEGKISYSYTHAKNKDTGKTLTNSPRHIGQMNLVIPLLKNRLFGGIEMQYMSKRKTLKETYTRSVFVTNVTLLRQNLIKGLELSATVYNLFNRKYGDPGAEEHLELINGNEMEEIEQDGRSYRVKLTYTF